jgi:phosphatidylglycerol:prolipoprotein diacylglycerol transferase
VDPCNLPTCVKIGIDPVALHIGTFALYWYGLLVALGFVIAIRIATREAERVGVNPDQLLSATLVAALFGLLLARVYFVLQNQPQYYIDGKHLGDALSLWQGGLTFYGGILGAILGAWLYTTRYNLPILPFLDLGALVAPLGQAIGRIGNLINGDIVGISSSKFGIEYTNSNNLLLPADQIGRSQHPVAAYDVVVELLLFGVLMLLWRRRLLRPGQAAGLYLVGFAASQLLLGAFRATPSGVAGFKTAQLTALPIVAGGLWLLLRSQPRPIAAPAEAPTKATAGATPIPAKDAGAAKPVPAKATGGKPVPAKATTGAKTAPAKATTGAKTAPAKKPAATKKVGP